MPKPAAWQFANGRALPSLLFVTCVDKLGTKIGVPDATDIVAAITAAGQRVLPLSSAQAVDAPTAIAATAASLTPDLAGVVLIGGPEVVPPQVVDTLSPTLAASVNRYDEADRYIVWSDDAYGGQGDQKPKLPVTRIPDGASAAFVWTCLAAPACPPNGGSGVRNVARPFADPIYAAYVSPAPAMLQSIPTRSTVPPSYAFTPYVYIMMHGSDANGAQFYGEDLNNGYPVAVQPQDVPAARGMTAFTGCCWGALTTTAKAADGVPIASRAVASSIALTFLERGARAFLGCTGTHYSPTDAPYQYYGGPLHEAFFKRYVGGGAPAEALFNAKYVDYGPGIPHGSSDPGRAAYEQKIMLEFTSLGLGW